MPCSTGTVAKTALISVSDKAGILDFGRAIVAAGYRILSTGGTARMLREGGLPVEEVSDYTGFPEILDGRVKTLHPKIHGGLLARRDHESHRSAMVEHGIRSIDLLVVNLYPFQETVARPGVTLEDAIEQIDIGGPSMLRAAAKNHEAVGVVVDPTDYSEVIQALERDREIPGTLRRRLAAKVYRYTALYDAAIARYLAGREGNEGFAEECVIGGRLRSKLRYGENPHQRGAFYCQGGDLAGTVAGAEFLGGKELSYNNILDLDAAWSLVNEFDASETPACVIVKHGNPCGAARASDLAGAWVAALDCDPMSAFGSVVACNVVVEDRTAGLMAKPGNFIEAMIAPGYSDGGQRTLRHAKFGRNLRLLATGSCLTASRHPGLRAVSGGFLLQDVDAPAFGEEGLRLETVSKRGPSEEELRDLDFAWRVAKHVRSNAIVLAKGGRTVGVGAGQMSRVDSVEIACRKAGQGSRGSVLASDAFFPFPDGIERAASAGVTAVIQPGGSRRDPEVIEAADQAGVAMIMTHVRHFRH
ncbi:MAG: bifunctional phosphoribosylaminoimidazolecarboxamide formyltransferase/IMP cyclohydrolase [Planctomycetota bacterium]